MRIGFFGTPEIAVRCLEKLIQKHQVLFAVTAEDKPSGRRLKIKYSPVKDFCIKNNIKLFQPEKLNNKDFIDKLKNENADIFIVIAYGKLIPPDIFNIPGYKTINLHPSLLPKYRGAAPIQWALINGEEETGITIQLMNEKLDEGDILTQKNIPINASMSAEDLYEVVCQTGSDLLMNTLDDLTGNKLKPVRQDHDAATCCEKIDKILSRIDWSQPAFKIHNHVRALYPSPCAWTTFRDKNIKILKSAVSSEECLINGAPGTILKYQKKRLFVLTGEGNIEILKLKPETKNEMDAAAFLNGCRLLDNEAFI